MTTDDAIPTAAELWTLLQDQAARIADLKAEVERQRVEKLSLTSRLAEMEGGHSPNDRKLSRAGLLKAAAIGAAASVGAGSLLQASSGTALAASGSFDASGAGASAVTATATNGAEGIHATSDTHIGIYGQSTSSYAIYGDSSSGRGVYGHSTSNIGIEGQSSDGFGVYGSSTNSPGLYGVSANGAGVFGSGGTYGGEFGGGLASLRLLLPGNAGPPTTSSHFAGELSVDSGGVLWTCVTPGTPGTWVPLMHGNSNDGSNNALLTKVSTQQYTLTSSDGTSWVNLDATNLSLTFTPKQNALAIISGNSDLWTSNAGYNQDLGISLKRGELSQHSGTTRGLEGEWGLCRHLLPQCCLRPDSAAACSVHRLHHQSAVEDEQERRGSQDLGGSGTQRSLLSHPADGAARSLTLRFGARDACNRA